MLGWVGMPAMATVRPARKGPMQRQRISEKSLGSNCCASAVEPHKIVRNKNAAKNRCAIRPKCIHHLRGTEEDSAWKRCEQRRKAKKRAQRRERGGRGGRGEENARRRTQHRGDGGHREREEEPETGEKKERSLPPVGMTYWGTSRCARRPLAPRRGEQRRKAKRRAQGRERGGRGEGEERRRG